MKISKSWLKSYIVPNLSDEEIADKLSLSGTSVEAIEKGIDPGVIVVEIRNIIPHPQADRLRLATVFDGTEELTVVCGAPNIEVGQKVPLAKIGTNLPAGKIEKAVIRGVESCGMLCAPDELGLGEDHSGIFILPEDYVAGLPLSEQLKSDTIFDIEITPNRGDCLSHIGIARELSALVGKTIKKEPISLDSISEKVSSKLEVEIKDAKLCSQYQARMIEGVTVAESPEWLKQKLISIGSKPINNIVDVTNYIMFDLGQPLHAFDYDKISGRKIVVRTAQKNEQIVTLDGITRKLENNHLVIADKDKPVAVAGIMGGINSEISNKTKNIVLESAEFLKSAIYRCSKDLGLSTDASYRFERGIDSATVEYALNKAAKMIADLSGGKILTGIVREVSKNESIHIRLEEAKINEILGTKLSRDEMIHILKLLGFEIKEDLCLVPSWRHDINIWQDLAEEIGRIYGYGKIEPVNVPVSNKSKNSSYYFSEYLKDILVECGFTETLNYAFLSEEDAKMASLKVSSLIEVANPIQAENKYLRNSLIPNLLKCVAKNPASDQIFLFEIGHIYTKDAETKMLSIVTAGKDARKQIEFATQLLADKAGISLKLMQITEIPRDELSRFKIKKPLTYVVEIALDKFEKIYLAKKDISLKISNKIVHYRPISKYPSLTRDVAFIVDKKTDPDKLKEIIYSVSDSINRVELFDEFSSDKFGKGKKNIAYHLFISRLDRTMTDQEADQIMKEISKIAKINFGAELRQF